MHFSDFVVELQNENGGNTQIDISCFSRRVKCSLTYSRYQLNFRYSFLLFFPPRILWKLKKSVKKWHDWDHKKCQEAYKRQGREENTWKLWKWKNFNFVIVCHVMDYGAHELERSSGYGRAEDHCPRGWEWHSIAPFVLVRAMASRRNSWKNYFFRIVVLQRHFFLFLIFFAAMFLSRCWCTLASSDGMAIKPVQSIWCTK